MHKILSYMLDMFAVWVIMMAMCQNDIYIYTYMLSVQIQLIKILLPTT
jgi:hypothetical protein